jgi:catechol 2,3-dioxygenase-like lactoylglutathione lyase family enzyme
MQTIQPAPDPATPETASTPATGRVQLALNVTDLESSVRFYSDLFGTAPVKRKPGYANFAIAEPPLKLILFQSDQGGTINHLGVEVPTSGDVEATIERLGTTEMHLDIEQEVTCCYATQDKVWATAPDGERWEYYTVLKDADRLDSDTPSCECTDAACTCGTSAPVGAAPACCTTVA